MLSLYEFAAGMVVLVIAQELADRYAIKMHRAEKPAILLAISSGTYCLLAAMPDQVMLVHESKASTALGVLGIIHFGILRHWLFLFRARKMRDEGGMN